MASSSLRQTALTCSGHTRPVVDLAFSDITESGYYLISACKDGKPMIRQGETGDWIGTFEGHKGAVWGVALNRDATKAATGAADFMAKLWDATTGEEVHSFMHSHIVKSVDFSPDGVRLLTGSNEKLLRIFDLERPDADPDKFSGHQDGLKTTKYLKDGKRIVSLSDDKTLRIWDCGTRQEIKKLEFKTPPNGMEVSADGTTLVVAHGNFASFFNVDSLEKLQEVRVPSTVNSASLHPDKTVFVCGGIDFKMYKFDYSSGAEIVKSYYSFPGFECFHVASKFEQCCDKDVCLEFQTELAMGKGSLSFLWPFGLLGFFFELFVASLDVVVLSTKSWFLFVAAIYRYVFPHKRKSIAGEIALVSGAGHGMGREIAIKLSELGATVICWDINKDGLQLTLNMISRVGGRGLGDLVDVSNCEAVKAGAARILEKIGHVTILVNNAGILSSKPFLSHSPREIERVFSVNVFSHFWTLEAVLPSMVAKGRGHIVAMSSIAGVQGIPYLVAYGASKSAVTGLMDGLLEELRYDDKTNPIKLTVVHPFIVNTGHINKPRIRFSQKNPPPRFKFLMPVTEPRVAADMIIDGVLRNKEWVFIPWWIEILYRMSKIWPRNVHRLILDFLDAGVSKQ
ncbi:unnamed protein product [Notodromas monacha]|uniref:Serine-threonine kinase receptor-associated protein n=1 Tax=Notodromas monacha TaxID=399045 RepID=A0A7R9BLH6_9CRUS|nr:unnamed protein product [Notodromas monacha]CAG0916841.1 unnamed protein product [Notodromas monacha]